MIPLEPHRDDLDGLLLDAVGAVRKTSIDESLVERCRQSALDLGQSPDDPRSFSEDGWSQWLLPVGLAASVLLLINVVQAYSRLPSSSRELVAIRQSANAGPLYIYSDLSIEPVPSHLADKEVSNS